MIHGRETEYYRKFMICQVMIVATVCAACQRASSRPISLSVSVGVHHPFHTFFVTNPQKFRNMARVRIHPGRNMARARRSPGSTAIARRSIPTTLKQTSRKCAYIPTSRQMKARDICMATTYEHAQNLFVFYDRAAAMHPLFSMLSIMVV